MVPGRVGKANVRAGLAGRVAERGAAQPLAILHSSGTLRKLQAARRAPQLLATHPAADDACAVGVPTQTFGEPGRACIVPTEGAMITGDEPKELGTP